MTTSSIGTTTETGTPVFSDVEAPTFHKSGDSNRWRNQIDPLTREFVVWDGEGITREDGSHAYVLFGAYDGTEHYSVTHYKLSTLKCIQLMFDVKRKHPAAFHVAFAFDYDANMILNSLTQNQFELLRRTGFVRFYHYLINHVPGKWLTISDMRLEKNNVYRTVRIEDAWGFFQGSFLRALETYIPDHPHFEDIKAGKERRNLFTYADMKFIQHYWEVENIAFHALMHELRSRLYSVNLRITKWHGPGALANYTYKQRGVANHKKDCGPEVYDAARYAYAGGRFELFRVGNHGKAWGIDINSAYPYAISQLPSLVDGTWIHKTSGIKRLVPFGLYRIRYAPSVKLIMTTQPSPFFHRDSRGNISYPHYTEGWYWTPEIRAAIRYGMRFQMLEAWEYVDYDETVKPFQFVAEMYEQRRELKAQNHGAQMALKLCLNSLYGKMAQRAGWERNKAAPKWHQLEWAGYVTSLTRATLFRVIAEIPWHHLAAVETDGIYITCDPAGLGITDDGALGAWSVTEYDELVYLQSGVYAKRQGTKWSSKYRGFDKDSLSTQQIVEHAERLVPGNDWPTLEGTTTRFIGYPAALNTDFAMHSRWETKPQILSIGSQGKRVHTAKMCHACSEGLTAAEMPHDLVIRSGAIQDIRSKQHDIPWLDMPEDKYAWREHAEMLEGFWNA